MDRTDTYEFISMARGYHQYQSIWSAVVGEELPCRIELSNPHDLFAVAICKADVIDDSNLYTHTHTLTHSHMYIFMNTHALVTSRDFVVDCCKTPRARVYFVSL